MSKLLTWVINVARIVIVGIILVTIWPTLQGMGEGKITWDQAVDSLFSNSMIVLLLVVLGLTLVISILRSTIARWAMGISVVGIIFCFVTGTITLESVSDSVDAYHLASEAKEVVQSCELNVAVEEFGGKFRAVLKDPNGEKIMGYIGESAEGVATLLNEKGKPLGCGEKA